MINLLQWRVPKCMSYKPSAVAGPNYTYFYYTNLLFLYSVPQEHALQALKYKSYDKAKTESHRSPKADEHQTICKIMLCKLIMRTQNQLRVRLIWCHATTLSTCRLFTRTWMNNLQVLTLIMCDTFKFTYSEAI